MKSPSKGLRRRFMENQLITTQYRTSNKKSNQEKEENIIHWITFFRRNWHIYVEFILGIKLRPFQQIMIYLMGISEIFFAICSRGLSKSFIAGLGAIVKMNLYPYSEVVITSSTVPQANKLVEKKIRDELIKKLSPYLLYMYEKEYLVITRAEDGYKIENKLNGSSLVVLACLDSSRGSRSTMLIYEEARLLKKTIIDSVFEKMSHPRQAKYLENPIYSSNPRWLEECQHIYITSARFKFEWFYLLFKKTFTRIFLDKRTKCNIFAGDIFMAIDNGLKTWADYRNGLHGDQYDFKMEDLNEMIGEADDAFFTIQSFRENQVIEECFRPPSINDLYMIDFDTIFPKQEDEIRIVGVDYAFANTVKDNQKNDNTIIMCISGIWKKNRFERRLDYIELHEASDSLGAADRARELFWLYHADYLVPDSRAGGETLFNRMTIPWTLEETHGVLNFHGLTISDKNVYHVVPEAKLADYRMRTVDKNAYPCIIPFISTSELNSFCWIELKKQIENNNIKLLISSQDKQTEIEDDGSFFKMTTEEIVKTLLPYGQTDELIHEAVNLKTEYRNDKIKLIEPRTGTKDRVVILAYCNYIFYLIENEWLKQQQNDYSSWDDFNLIY